MKSKFTKVLIFTLIAVLLFGTVSVSAFDAYETYTYSIDGEPMQSPHAYTATAEMSLLQMGVDSISSGEEVGFSVGKVRVDGKGKSSAGGAMSASVSPAAISYLEQTGLMNPAVPVVGCSVC